MNSAQHDVSRFSKMLHAAGWVANHDGNVSLKARDGKRFFATPTAMSKRVIDAHHVITVDEGGKVLSGRLRIFSEWHLHRACYRARPDIRCVLHAHPIAASAFGLAGRALNLEMPEPVVSLGEVPLIAYAPPKSETQDRAIGEALQGEADALMLEGNGVLAVGPDLETAYLRLELVEHVAQITRAALELGGLRALPDADRQALLKKRHGAGLGRGR